VIIVSTKNMEKDIKKVKQGKKSRGLGKAFEICVRKDLESKGWIVDRWTNNVKIEDENSKDVSGMFGGPFGKLVPAKAKWNNFTKSIMMGNAGFPDFVCFTQMTGEDDHKIVIAVECKMAGKLDKSEKQKCKWLLDNFIFSKILIASKLKEGRKVVIQYDEFT